MIEQRKDKRYDVSVTAEVFLPDRVLEATTRNLSRSGVCFECEPLLQEGATVAATLYLTVDGIEDVSTAPLKVTTQVHWTSELDDDRSLVGAQFVNLDETGQKSLDRFLSALGE
ncbi:MAG: PilZ domain-containing protein [Deltaproteobacteria bacterium]|nr:PilZ domain-containing protein [Deltaproteobacteria bacterium]